MTNRKYCVWRNKSKDWKNTDVFLDTGLRDTNGKEIYGNDIIRIYDEVTGEKINATVVFGNPSFTYDLGWYLQTAEPAPNKRDILLWVETEETGVTCTVIGNARENPRVFMEV